MDFEIFRLNLRCLLRIAGAAMAVATPMLIPMQGSAAPIGKCGQLISLSGHEGSTLNYTLAGPSAGAKAALVLLPGGGGYLNLDREGCPERLKGNSLVRKQSLFHEKAFLTALVDASSDYQGNAGLAGFRIHKDHAEDIGKVIADLRKRTALPVWLVGTSRGAISAANAASRLSGVFAPNGLILTSPVTSGFEGGRKPWVAQTVFSKDLQAIRIPFLVVVHADDMCIRTPPDLAPRVIGESGSPRGQSVAVSGGPGWSGGQSVEACKGRSPHGFLDQEADVVAGIARFIGGQKY